MEKKYKDMDEHFKTKCQEFKDRWNCDWKKRRVWENHEELKGEMNKDKIKVDNLKQHAEKQEGGTDSCEKE